MLNLAFLNSGNPRTLNRITEVWVPELQRLGVKVPLLLVGCKSDLRPQDQNMQQVSSYGFHCSFVIILLRAIFIKDLSVMPSS